MKKFVTGCKDSKTGYEMILSECSMNHAMFWLEGELAKHGLAIQNARPMKNGLVAIFTWRTSIDTNDLLDDMSPIGLYSGRTFFYDEERGYLLGE